MAADTAAPTTTTEIEKDERRSGLRTIAQVAPLLWPADKPWVKTRVVIALLLLVFAKIITVSTPFLYAQAVDLLAGEAPEASWTLAGGAIGITIAYGMSRVLRVAFEQLRDAVFARVAQRALRELALQTFRHIHAMSLRYHLTRRTGSLSRIIERGVKGIEILLRFLLFNIGP